MRIRWTLSTFLMAFAVLLSSCGSDSSSGNMQQMSYKDMKTMVIDILKSEDAKSAIQQSTEKSSGYTTQSSKLLSSQDQEAVMMAVKEVISSPDYDKVIKKLMTDTRFAGEFAKAVNKENKTIHKELIKDPTYQQELVKTMRTPEMEKMILEVLKSSNYRKEVMSLMQDAMQNPLFRVEVLDLMKTAVQEELRPKDDEKKDGEKEKQGSGDEQKQEGEEQNKGEEQRQDEL